METKRQLSLWDGLSLQDSERKIEIPILNRFGTKPSKIDPHVFTEEQLKCIDQATMEEIPNLRLIKKGKIIGAKDDYGRNTDVHLEENAILFREQSKTYIKRSSYYARVPINGISAGSNKKFEIERGQEVDTYSRQVEISQEQTPEVVQKLRNNIFPMDLVRLALRFPGVFPQIKG